VREDPMTEDNAHDSVPSQGDRGSADSPMEVGRNRTLSPQDGQSSSRLPGFAFSWLLTSNAGLCPLGVGVGSETYEVAMNFEPGSKRAATQNLA